MTYVLRCVVAIILVRHEKQIRIVLMGHTLVVHGARQRQDSFFLGLKLYTIFMCSLTVTHSLMCRTQELMDIGFWDNCRFFRVVPGFVVQFGINGNPDVQQKWRTANMADDTVKASNERGTVVFATAGPNSRTTQLFINTREQGNAFLDNQGFSPIGQVIEGKQGI